MEPDSGTTEDAAQGHRSSGLTRTQSSEEEASGTIGGRGSPTLVWPPSMFSPEGTLLPPTRYVCKVKKTYTVEKCGRQSATCSETQITVADGVKTVKQFEEGRLVAYTIDDVPQELLDETTVDEEDKKKIAIKSKSVGSTSFLSATSQPYESFSASVLSDDLFSYSKYCNLKDGIKAGFSPPGPSTSHERPDPQAARLTRRASS